MTDYAHPVSNELGVKSISADHIPDATKMVAPIGLIVPADGIQYDQDDDQDDDPECESCRGVGYDPLCDYFLPCPVCQSEQQP